MNKNRFPCRRGEIYYANLGKTNNGAVQRGVRPVVIIQNDIGNQESTTLIVVPITSQVKKTWLPVHVRVSTKTGLQKNSLALCEQITTIDKSQLISYVGKLEPYTFSKVCVSVFVSLGFMPVKARWQSYQEQPDVITLRLCEEHLQPYMEDRHYQVSRLDHFQNKAKCVFCEKMGFDYKITHLLGINNEKAKRRK